MADRLSNQFNRWLAIFVLTPAAVLALLCDILFINTLRESSPRALDDLSGRARVNLEQLIRAEATRVRTVASLPIAANLLQVSRRRDTADETPESIELQWSRADRNDLIVRSVLDNDVASTFARLRERDPHLGPMLLTDARANPIAATEKTARYSQIEQGWWKHARASSPDQVSAEGLDTTGRVRMVTGVLRQGFTNMAEGFLVAEVDVNALCADLLGEAEEGSTVFLLGEGTLPILGDEKQIKAVLGAIQPFLNAGESEGWARNFRFRVSPLEAGIAWRDPVRLVTVITQARVPVGLFLAGIGGVIATIGLLAALFILARRAGHAGFFDPMRESTEAGLWIFRTAYGDEAKEHASVRQPWAAAITERTSQVQRDLTRWLNRWKQELLAQSSSFSLELKRDLELATEFQQAFLNRPYPRIPEVHIEGRLRLEFNHRYQPALAMGGDFFDISPLSTDCAGILIADVMGHGTRSALIVSILRTLIAELSRRGRNAPHFIRELNTNFCTMLQSLPSPFFASAAYFVADTTSRVATYSLAGHPPPFYLHRATGRVSRLDMPKPQGSALGLIPNEEYGGATVRLNPGDAFLFFTDGVYEAANRAGEEFGFARLEKVLRSHVYKSSPEILDAVIKAIHDFVEGEPFADDVCLVTVDVATDAAPQG